MLSVLVFASAIVSGPPAARPACEPATLSKAVAQAPSATRGVQKLGDLPLARVERTVLRTVGRCQTPVIIRYEGQSAPVAKAASQSF